jgi:hypothetical protein
MSTLLGRATPDAVRRRTSDKNGISTALHLSVYITAFLVIALRRPDALFHPQFYGEDGAIWFAEAYNYGPLKALNRK